MDKDSNSEIVVQGPAWAAVLNPLLIDTFTALSCVTVPFFTWWCWSLGEGRVGTAVATVALLLPGDAVLQAASSSQVLAQHVLCSCAALSSTRSIPPVWGAL